VESDDEKYIALRARLRHKRASGELPRCTGPHAWAGRGGTGERCALCDSLIDRSEIEFEAEWHDGANVKILRFHEPCFWCWSNESDS
jgi:hypothetical protein